MLKQLRKHLIVVVIAFVTAFVVASVAGGSGAIARSRSRSQVPVVHTMTVAGPVNLPETSGTIASLALPQGKWTVFARMSVGVGDSLIDEGAICELTLGSGTSRGVADINPPSSGEINFMVSSVIPSAGNVELKCHDGWSQAIVAYDIVITAIKAGELTISTG